MAGRYGRGVYISNLSVYSPHSATRCRGGYTSSHTEKKHTSETRERTNCWEDLQAKIVRGSSSSDHSFLSSLVALKVLLYFKYVCRIIWSRAFYLVKFVHKRFIYHGWTNNCLWSAFILIGALLITGALLFFLQSAFLFLHSAFLMLHSAPLKFPVWVSTCIFSLIVSQRAIYLFWYSY